MSRILTISLPDNVYDRIAAAGRTQSKAPEEVAAALLTHAEAAAAAGSTKRAAGAKRGDISRFFGALDGSAGSTKSEDIDADLAQAGGARKL